jgi:hypothetical protein
MAPAAPTIATKNSDADEPVRPSAQLAEASPSALQLPPLQLALPLALASSVAAHASIASKQA